MTAPKLVDHFFRHEYGRLVSMLSHRVGLEHLDAVEDAVQSALMSALETWTTTGTPDNPSAWLYRVAHNELVGNLRQHANRRRILDRDEDQKTSAVVVGAPDARFDSEIQDDLLRMLFVCCNEAIPIESQLVFALKTLCGFSVKEIALRLFTTEANVYKRLARAKERLRKSPPNTEETNLESYAGRLSAVHKILYLIFTEGYLSSAADMALRQDLCREAIRLGHLLAEHPVGKTPSTHALIALMHLHSARMTSRQNGSGGLLLLEEQDRSLWDQHAIREGLSWLAKSAEGEEFSRYHAEAGIAAEHCLAPSFEQTRWDRVVECYALLERLAPSPLHRLNRAIATAEWRGPEAGLAVLDSFEPPSWLAGSYQWAAVLADLHRRSKDVETANRYREIALDCAPTPAVKVLLERRLADAGDV